MDTIYTIGYEGSEIERFVTVLREAGIKTVADVRAVALSRKKGFSKKGLSSRLKYAGINYLHFVQLGDPKPGRDAARAALYQRFREIYTLHLSKEDSQSSLAELLAVAREKPTCLLCFERDPEICHRSIIATELSNSDFWVCHLFCDETKPYVSDAPGKPGHYSREGIAAA